MNNQDLDILCFGAHPDDVEIGMAGTIRKYAELGYRIGICDLTRAELSSNGNVTIRKEEADKAAHILGVKERMNVGFPDRGLELNGDVLGTIVNVLRHYKPQTVFIPYEEDRHPDHGMVSKILEEALFTANIRKYQWGNEKQNDRHKVDQVFYYMINGLAKPQVVVDISDYIEVKKKALLSYQSQFVPSTKGVQTRLNTEFIDVIEGRERLFGKMIDVSFAEGFMVKEPIQLHQLISNRRG